MRYSSSVACFDSSTFALGKGQICLMLIVGQESDYGLKTVDSCEDILNFWVQSRTF